MSFAPLRFLPWFLALAATAMAAHRDLDQTFPVQPGCTVRIDSYRGSIKVQEGSPGQVVLNVHVQAMLDESDTAKNIINAVKIQAGADRNVVSIQVRNGPETTARWVWEDLPKANVSFTLTVPPGTRLDLLTADGGVTVGDLECNTKIRAHHGVVYLKHIDGDIDAYVDGANIVVSRCKGSVILATRQGDIRTGAIYGHADIRTVSGDIDVQRAIGGIYARTDAGDIKVGFSAGTPGASDVGTSFGAITVRLDPAAKCTIKASSVWGRVHVSVPLVYRSGGDGSRAIEADCAGGGAVIALHANGGTVEILPPHI